jgi:hypothetical protein
LKFESEALNFLTNVRVLSARSSSSAAVAYTIDDACDNSEAHRRKGRKKKIRKQRALYSDTSIRLETQSRLRERFGKALHMRSGEAKQVCNVVDTPAIAQTGASKRRPYP